MGDDRGCRRRRAMALQPAHGEREHRRRLQQLAERRVEPGESDLDRVRPLARRARPAPRSPAPVEGGEGPAALLRQPSGRGLRPRRGAAPGGAPSRRRHAVSRRTVRRRTPGRPWRRRGGRPARRSARPARCAFGSTRKSCTCIAATGTIVATSRSSRPLCSARNRRLRRRAPAEATSSSTTVRRRRPTAR